MKHSLSEIDIEKRRATCSACGPIDIKKRSATAWRCGQRHRETQRRTERSRNARRRAESRFGLPADVVESERERFLLEQESCCGICRKPVTIETGKLDHDHETGALRGILCNNCNLGLGLLGDSVDGIEAALAYLLLP